MRSSMNTGLLEPGPGSSVFHATPVVALHFVGRPFSSLTPDTVGPRNCGQSPPEAESASASVIVSEHRKNGRGIAHLGELGWVRVYRETRAKDTGRYPFGKTLISLPTA